MPYGLRGSLIGTVVVAMAALVLTILILEDRLVELRATDKTRGELFAIAERVASEIAAGADPDRVADRVGSETGSRVLVLGADDRPLGDTAFDRRELGLAGSVEITEALRLAKASGRGEAIVQNRATEESFVQVALRRGSKLVQVERPLVAVTLARESMRELLLVGGFLAVTMGAMLTFVLSRTMIRPIQRLTHVANVLATGDLSVRTRSQRADELGTLGRALDRMADELASRIRTLRAEEARLRIVLDAMVEAVFVTDAQGSIVLTNEALARMVRTDPRGRSAVEAIRSPELYDAVRRARRGEAAAVEFETRVGDEVHSFAVQVAPLPEDAGVVGVLHDVTNLKLADRIRRDFVANASHELRTPLTAIRGFAETLRDGALGDPESAKRFVDMILKHTGRLQRLGDDLLALSRAESPEDHYEIGVIDAGAIASEVVLGLEPQAARKGVALRTENLDGLPPALGNHRALDEIFVNLVDNAIKYTPAGGDVIVRASTEGEHITLLVRDTGPGIPHQHLDRIFERFYRVDKGRSRDAGGTGLGLSIVKHLSQRIGAEVGVESQPGRGSTFRIVLRRAEVPMAVSTVEDASV